MTTNRYGHMQVTGKISLKIAAAPRAMKVGHPGYGQQRRRYTQQQKGCTADALSRRFVEREHPCFLWRRVYGETGVEDDPTRCCCLLLFCHLLEKFVAGLHFLQAVVAEFFCQSTCYFERHNVFYNHTGCRYRTESRRI